MIDSPLPFPDPLDCEQSLFFFRFSAGECTLARASSVWSFACLARVAGRNKKKEGPLVLYRPLFTPKA